ncbi:MAG: hypothetical protein GTO60_07905, partial [Gammaproteobacteria bacterium]|nr:hypothetical protein [Gammaproteobacteria bacterium]
ATAAGNILINETRPNVKQDSPSNILDRIPAGNVVRIDLIRGQMTGVDMQGQPVVVNIILREDSEASVRWEAYVWKNTDVDILMPGGAISLSNRWNDWDFNIGVDGNRHGHATIGSRNSFDADGNLTEDRNEDIINTHLLINGNFNASTTVGETLLQFNTKYRYSKVDETLEADRIPQALGSIPRQEEVVDDRLDKDFELGVTAERSLTENLLGKGIFIFNTGTFDETSQQTVVELPSTQTLFRIADRGNKSNEAITRFEFDWIGIDSHSIQLNMEGAYNSLDQNFLQTDDT